MDSERPRRSAAGIYRGGARCSLGEGAGCVLFENLAESIRWNEATAKNGRDAWIVLSPQRN